MEDNHLREKAEAAHAQFLNRIAKETKNRQDKYLENQKNGLAEVDRQLARMKESELRIKTMEEQELELIKELRNTQAA